jgi:hybrid polyketide synthase/nonribosomal peptide synthetase ACE1
VTKTIIKDLGEAFRSYTYTDISSGFFEKAQDVFHEYRDRMVFRTLDAEKDPITQSYSEGSYDLIVCSLVLHATQDLEVTLANVRRLLKPGGYLALLEITDLDSFRTGFAMSALPGWWLGHADGRALNPCVPAARWDAELRKTGFSGIKAKTEDHDALVWPFSVIVAQATHADVSRLADPLSLSPQMQDRHITLIGGSTAATATLAGQLESLLRPWYKIISRIDTVAQFLATDTALVGTVLSITELDVPYFKDLTDTEWQGLRNLLDQSRNVLWITCGGAGVDPYAVMMTGFARTLAREMPHLRMQCLDLDAEVFVAPEVIAQAMLSLELSEIWEQDSESKILWSLEPEAAIYQGVMMIPRMFATKELNDRYNSTRRTITRQADLKKEIATLISRSSGELQLVAKAKDQKIADDEDYARLAITHSTATALRISSDHRLFVVAGINLDTKEQTIAVSGILASEITVPKSWTIARSESKDKEPMWLTELGWQLLARYLITRTPPGGIILVQNSPSPLIEHLGGLARANGTSFAYITTDPANFNDNAIFLHQNSPNSVLRNVLPPRISLFVDLDQSTNVAARSLSQLLPITCVQLSASDLFASEAFDRTCDVETVASKLRHAVSSIVEPTAVGQSVIPVQTYSSAHENTRGLEVILSWKSSATVPVSVQPVDCKPLFRKDRTYLLFGLSGQIGRSLARWMTAHGAKYIVLTSRNPVTDERWLEKVQRGGAKVRLVANDITDRQAVIELVQEVQRTL